MPKTRTVRSFVRRSGRLTPSQARALDTLWPLYGVDYTERHLDLVELFGRENDKVLEIGFGNGDSLVQQARENPNNDYLGIEVHRPGVGHCLLQAEKDALANLRVIAHDALEVLEHQIAARSLSRINLYFPDPWPKKRHQKRRILQPAFLCLAASRLLPGGSLRIATDWQDYAEHIDALLAGSKSFEVIERRRHRGENALDRPQTRFEKRGLDKGHEITDWQLAKI